MTEKNEYKLRLKIKNKTLQFRKWRVKDKNKFLKNLDDVKLIKEALVYDCLENKTIALSEEEYKYLLLLIRAESLGTEFGYEFSCAECTKDYSYKVNINNIQKPVFKPYSEISVQNHSFKMQDIRNRSFYDNAIVDSNDEKEKYLIDFILHVGAYNNNDGITFSDINNIINELEINIFEEIISQWDIMKFKIDTEHEVNCPHCSAKQIYEFDTLPEFFPESWDI